MRRKKELHETYPWMYPALLLFSAALIVFGLSVGGVAGTLAGLKKIILSEGALITDYIALAGIGPSFVNAGLVMLASLFILHGSDMAANGFMICIAGLMAGFALFGKNIANIWSIVFGAYLYSKVKKQPFHENVTCGLLSTTLAPVVSMVALQKENHVGFILLGIFVGICIGFVMPSIAAFTAKIQNGFSLYNVGFAAGLLAMLLVPLLSSFEIEPQAVRIWSTGNNKVFGIALGIFCFIVIAIGLIVDKQALKHYWALLKTSGKSPSDYLEMFGIAPVLINMGMNGLLATGYILAIGGDLNGPTIGAVLTILGFSSFGKHLFNIIPVMLGIVLASFISHWSLQDMSMQIIALFGTTLTPIAGHFGWPYGLLAGFLHASAAQRSGLTAAGLNLYNNGFTGGLITIVLYPIFAALAPKKTRELIEQEEREHFLAEE